VAGFSIGGKTGTSEKIDVFDENGQRVQDKIVSFVGIAPMEDPQYIVLAALDTPSRETGIYISGGVMAAPTVGAVMADILPYLGVEKTQDTAPEIEMEDYSGLTAETAGRKLKESGLKWKIIGDGQTVTEQLPAPGQKIPAGSEILLYLGEEPEVRTVTVPDFTGLHRQQAAEAAGKLGLYLQITGNETVSANITVISQNIPKDSQVPVGTTITLEFTDKTARD
jgi:stage V sporulation protein D (sporulation-specific penicillin-binding protein)